MLPAVMYILEMRKLKVSERLLLMKPEQNPSSLMEDLGLPYTVLPVVHKTTPCVSVCMHVYVSSRRPGAGTTSA